MHTHHATARHNTSCHSTAQRGQRATRWRPQLNCPHRHTATSHWPALADHLICHALVPRHLDPSAAATRLLTYLLTYLLTHLLTYLLICHRAQAPRSRSGMSMSISVIIHVSINITTSIRHLDREAQLAAGESLLLPCPRSICRRLRHRILSAIRPWCSSTCSNL